MIHGENLTRRAFKDWLSIIYEHYTMKRCRFVKEKQANQKALVFEALYRYSFARIHFKRNMKAFIKGRALKLLRLAFIRGLKKNWHRHVINRKFELAAEIANKARLQSKPF